MNNKHKNILKKLSGYIINIGSGTDDIGADVINVDLIDYDNVSIVADIHQLPFKDASVDAVFNIAVLEHVPRPIEVIAEVNRVLKKGGVIFSVIPFMQPFHASPHDYQRYSLSGIQYLHNDFEAIDFGTYGGPISGFLWIAQEFLAVLFSFGVVRLRNILSLIFMLITWPIKYLDLIFRNLKVSKNISSSFYFYGKKL